MKLSLPCQHQGLLPTVIMVGPLFEQRQILVRNGLPHQLVPVTAQRPFSHDYKLQHFFLIGNQKYPPYLWLILDLANSYLTVRGCRAEVCNSSKMCLVPSLRNTELSKDLQTAASPAAQIPHPGPPHCQSAVSCSMCTTRVGFMKQHWCKNTSSLNHLLDTAVQSTG